MKIACLVKFVPDTDEMVYDYEKNILNRENAKTIINPDDAAAVEVALKIKDLNTDTKIELISMGNLNIYKFIEDYCRRGVDFATIISDKKFIGSDSLSTSKILSTYLKKKEYNLILCGNRTIDGETGHVGPQIAEFLDVIQFSNVVNISDISENSLTAIIIQDNTKMTFNIKMPCVLSVEKSIVKRVRFTKFANLNLDVKDRIKIVSNDELLIDEKHIGLKGSPTKVDSVGLIYTKKESSIILQGDEAVDTVYEFLKEKGFV